MFTLKLVVPQLVKNVPAFYGTRKFITAFTTACHFSLINPVHAFIQLQLTKLQIT
jgi:hypothetical protein